MPREKRVSYPSSWQMNESNYSSRSSKSKTWPPLASAPFDRRPAPPSTVQKSGPTFKPSSSLSVSTHQARTMHPYQDILSAAQISRYFSHPSVENHGLRGYSGLDMANARHRGFATPECTSEMLRHLRGGWREQQQGQPSCRRGLRDRGKCRLPPLTVRYLKMRWWAGDGRFFVGFGL
jgi:hypothetical protein